MTRQTSPAGREWETLRRAGGVLLPGLPLLAAGVERHPVPGGGSRTVAVEAGDEIAIEDREGLQPCEIAYFDGSGRSALGALGLQATGAASGAARMLHEDNPSARSVRKRLKRLGCDISAAEGARLFAEGSRAGETWRGTASEAGTLVVAAAGEPMRPDEANPPSEIVLYVRRASRPNRKRLPPPPPLADPLQDFNIEPGKAKAYEVREGQFVQILDVQGRECSDFQAWDLRAVDRGAVLDIDPTTTRSMTGIAYPGPGIYSKYFSVEQTPLVEIVQDTVGRHDAFNLACTARYYEDLGYPGHLNCSDNLNRQAEQYDAGQRAGWPAINFFYNTMLDSQNGIGMDDPWSRPGDYVLLRALTDLVCFSTACPCDVDYANAWEPTDIQVRVYGGEERFSRAMALRPTPKSEPVMTKETAFHDRIAARTRNFTEYGGYWIASDFTGLGAVDEYWAVRTRAGLMDLSALRKFEILGPDAEELLQTCLTRDVRRLSVGRVVYSAMCYEHGGMIDDGTLYRLGQDNFRWIGGTDASGLWLREQAEKLGLHAWVKSSTDQLHNLALQGPLSREILSSVVWTPPVRPSVGELGWFGLTVGRIGGFEGIPLVVSRTGYSGELGYEIFCHPRDGNAVFDAIWTAGEPHGLSPFGLDALDMLRIEAGLVFAGQEFDDQTDPFEAGIGFTVALKSTNEPFIGREALEARKSSPQRRLVGLELEGGQVPVAADGIHVGRAQVGQVTSAVRSPALGKSIALARVAIPYVEPGTRLEVGLLDGLQKRIPAKIVRFPHYDPDKARVRS